eukprot:898100-Prorocentrum_minimum.AAC.1
MCIRDRGEGDFTFQRQCARWRRRRRCTRRYAMPPQCTAMPPQCTAMHCNAEQILRAPAWILRAPEWILPQPAPDARLMLQGERA